MWKHLRYHLFLVSLQVCFTKKRIPFHLSWCEFEEFFQNRILKTPVNKCVWNLRKYDFFIATKYRTKSLTFMGCVILFKGLIY